VPLASCVDPLYNGLAMTVPRKSNGRKKLTDAQIADVRARLEHGARQIDLAVMFGVTQAQISYIKTGRRRKK